MIIVDYIKENGQPSCKMAVLSSIKIVHSYISGFSALHTEDHYHTLSTPRQSLNRLIIQMMMTQPSPLTPEIEDKTFYLVERSTPDIQDFCHNYPLRRHKFEDKANEGSYQCRADWAEYIGSIGRWENCNPWEEHFGAVVLPLCRPEKLAVISYILGCTFFLSKFILWCMC